MAENEQKKEFPCSKCGGKLEFKPGLDQIECVYCGHKQDIPGAEKAKDFVAKEYDLEDALKNAKKFTADKLVDKGKEIRCNGCGASSIITEQSDRCPFCASPVVVEASSSEEMFIPESILPFKVDKKSATQKFKDWISGLWFAPNDLKKRAQQKGMDGVYLPYWTYDAETTTAYTGERGEYYYETEYYTDAEGNEKSREVQKTRWYPTSGTVRVSFDDVLVCASKSIPEDIVNELEPWDLQELKPYEASYLSGFITERYKVDLKEGYGKAQERMKDVIRTAIERDIGGDTQRIHSTNTNYYDTTFKHILLPLWISSFRYSEKVYRFMVNARTG
ncbi:MAG: hypothetical protein KDK45_25300, partial [Leptospiraceae bacterium]|nr:hypothetical protein [Leptospiraceae bacterium]